MTLSAGVVSLKQQTQELVTLAATKNPRTISREEKAEFYETIGALHQTVCNELKKQSNEKGYQGFPNDPIRLARAKIIQRNDIDHKTIEALEKILDDLKFSYGQTTVDVAAISISSFYREQKSINIDNTATFLDLKKSAAEIFQIPIQYLAVDGNPDDNQECLKQNGLIKRYVRIYIRQGFVNFQ